MSRMVCMKCNLFFHPKKNGVVVEEGMPADQFATPGQGEWLPYKLWRADLWECRGCGAEVVAGFGHTNFSEHYLPSYKKDRIMFGEPIAFVKDCL